MSKYAKFLELSTGYARVIQWAKSRIFGEVLQSPTNEKRKMVEMFDPDLVSYPRIRYGQCLRHPFVGKPIMHLHRDSPFENNLGDFSIEMRYIQAIRECGMSEFLMKCSPKKLQM